LAIGVESVGSAVVITMYEDQHFSSAIQVPNLFPDGNDRAARIRAGHADA
jgi:hypothetical protein